MVDCLHCTSVRVDLDAQCPCMSNSFGTSVVLSSNGRVALIGAPEETIDGHQWQAAVHVYTLSGDAWKQTAELTGPDTQSADSFGSSIALSADGRSAYVGLPTKNNVAGMVMLYALSGDRWIKAGELIPPGNAPSAAFGSSIAVALDGRFAVVGAPSWLRNSLDIKGSVYSFRASQFTGK